MCSRTWGTHLFITNRSPRILCRDSEQICRLSTTHILEVPRSTDSYGAASALTCISGPQGATTSREDFSGGMWTSPIGVGGGGLGAWSMTPSNGQQMDFAWAGGAFEGGMVAIFWYIGGVVKGSMNFVVAGLGGGGGKGSGTWTKA